MPQWEGDIATNGERDSYDVRLIAGRTYSIELEGYYTGDPRYDLRDPEVYLYRGGALIDDDDDSGQGYNSRIIFTPTVTTTYRIVAGEHGDNATGSYRLTVSEDDFRDLDTYNNVGTLGSFSTLSYSGSEAEGRIGYQGDNDLFAIDLIGGLSYNFGVSGTGSSGLADPRLQIYTDVKVTEALNSGGDPEDVDFTFEPAATGTYYLRVGEELDSATGRYKLFADLGRAGDGDDTITGTAGANGVFAGGGNDTVSLGAGNDRAYGANGNDTLLGEAGEDWLVGGPGRDRLRGGDDADVLAGATGADTLIGGRGGDIFLFLSAQDSRSGEYDTIRGGDGATAFQGAGAAAGDLIDLSRIDAKAGVRGNQAFELEDGPGRGHVWIKDAGSVTIIRASTDTDSAAEIVIAIEDGSVRASAYTAADFIL